MVVCRRNDKSAHAEPWKIQVTTTVIFNAQFLVTEYASEFAVSGWILPFKLWSNKTGKNLIDAAPIPNDDGVHLLPFAARESCVQER